MALSWSPSATPISSLQFYGDSDISIPFNRNTPFSTIPIFRNPTMSISAAPICLKPHTSIRRLHCFTSSSPSIEPNNSSSATIFIKGLPQSTAEGRLKSAFSQFGEVSRVKIISDKKSKQPLGFAYIWFTSVESAEMAVKEMNGKFFDGRFVLVTIAKPGSCKTRARPTRYKF
ncbi:hypothetical protein NMG60_11025240 [Bertholletia excelsa]